MEYRDDVLEELEVKDMKQKATPKGKLRQYNLFCLRNEALKRVYLTISFSSEPEAVLRKHWRGDVPETKEFFSKYHKHAEPNMWIWEIGFVTRMVALVYLKKWESLFLQEGYEIIGNEISSENTMGVPELSGTEKRRLRNLSVSAFFSGRQGKCVECDKLGGKRLAPSQKFATSATDGFLQFRVRYDTVVQFRELCDRLGMTQNQGLELLMSSYTGNYDPLLQDLQSRLEKAVAELNKKDLSIQDLKTALRKSEEGKEYPKKYQAAILQHQLLRSFLEQLPVPDISEKYMIKRCSYRRGKYVLPERMDYRFPAQEGVIKLAVEHMDYSKGPYACLFVYGKNEKGEKIKIRWYTQKQNRFGEWMWDSPYLWVGSLWYLAVRRDGEVMELVGSIPDVLSVYVSSEEEPETMESADPVQSLIREDRELSIIYDGRPEPEDPLLDEAPANTKQQDGYLDLLIAAAEKKKDKKSV